MERLQKTPLESAKEIKKYSPPKKKQISKKKNETSSFSTQPNF